MKKNIQLLFAGIFLTALFSNIAVEAKKGGGDKKKIAVCEDKDGEWDKKKHKCVMPDEDDGDQDDQEEGKHKKHIPNKSDLSDLKARVGDLEKIVDSLRDADVQKKIMPAPVPAPAPAPAPAPIA